MSERIRVMRVIVYEGEREDVERQLSRSNIPNNGVYVGGPGQGITFRSAIIGPEIPGILDFTDVQRTVRPEPIILNYELRRTKAFVYAQPGGDGRTLNLLVRGNKKEDQLTICFDADGNLEVYTPHSPAPIHTLLLDEEMKEDDVTA